MKIRRVICKSGPASQFTYVNQFIALRTRNVRKHTYPPTALQHLFWRPSADFMNSPYLILTHWVGRQALVRHKGIGSLPSAITTACSALTAELPGGEMFVWIALYNPASATTVSRTSSSLFIGGGSPSRILLRVRSICLVGASGAARPVDNCLFLRTRAL